MGRRGRGKGSRGGPQGRMRVRERGQGGRSGRGGEGGGRGRGSSFDAGEIEGYARRLWGSGGGASALAGAASGLAGGTLASRFLGGREQGTDEDFKAEILERLSLMDERLHRLEEQVDGILGGAADEDPAHPTEPGDAGPEVNP